VKREEGVLDVVLLTGTEMRLHFFERNGGIVRRIPWHKDAEGVWYSGIEGPEMSFDALKKVVDRV
jgi:hypothetical protein